MPTSELEAQRIVPHEAEQPTHHLELEHLIEAAAHLLPSQGPIEVFVHHNTLHVFESESFHQAVQRGVTRFGGEPYLSEQEYRRLLRSGRITDDDLTAVLAEELGPAGDQLVDGLSTRREIRLAMLQHPIHSGPDAELRWLVAESDALDRFRPETSSTARERVLDGARKWLDRQQSTDSNGLGELEELRIKFGRNSSAWSARAWESFALHLVWRLCRQGVQSCDPQPSGRRLIRPRDLVLRATGADTDREVHDVLIRFCGAYVDQGYSDWLLPQRSEGFFKSFLTLYSRPSFAQSRWLRPLAAELQRHLDQQITPLASIMESLEALRIAPEDRSEFLIQTMMSLRGWAGIIWQLESGVDWVVHSLPPGSLTGMLAIQLLLERQSILSVGKEVFGRTGTVAEILEQAAEQIDPIESMSDQRRAFLVFQVAQMLGWPPDQLHALSEAEWTDVCREVEGFSAIERRRIYHEAYERHYRVRALDAFAAHAARRKSEPAPPRPDFQLMTCIDDREESFRRHLEEVHPTCETIGAAGFFAVAINYRGAADGFYKPLCPAVITPSIYVQEDVGYTFEGVHRSRTMLRKQLGLAGHMFQHRSRGFLGGIFAGITGSLATAPLVARVLFPHLTARIRRMFGSWLQPPTVTHLQLERYAETPGPNNGHIGYTVDEMADVVIRLLQDIGVTKKEHFSRLFIACGHGSSSLNNPHESAYCCGACAGKRGGPNARAFAEMSNDWRVRAKVAERGVEIPDDTVFVGAYHNTCDDSVVYYDLDRLPASHRTDFETARVAIEEARRRNAHERCRRFDNVSLSVTPAEALRHVESRAQDISQARPEYNHATNALCVVGRRGWNRGLFIDRRAFLTSYDPSQDDAESSILFRILSAAIPVCAGISLEYYFSCVDHVVYGSGSKLPHNVVSLLGVMEGTSSDLRTGLYQQMVEIHEPLRLMFVIEASPEAMLSIIDRSEPIRRLCQGEWVHLAVIDPETSEIQVYKDGSFQPYQPTSTELPQVVDSSACYQGQRGHRPFFSIAEGARGAEENQ